MDNLEKYDKAKWADTVDVYVQVSYTKIFDVDTVNQRFQAEAIIESRWYDPSVTSLDATIDSTKIWKPDLYIDNSINDTKEDLWYRVVSDKNEIPMVCEVRKVKGLFWEKLELENFPMDIQDLDLIITTKKSGNKVNFVLLQPEITNVNISNTLDDSMWYLHKVVRTTKSKIQREYTYGKRDYPSISVRAQAFRLPGFFYWNVVLPILLITLTSLGPFVIDLKLPQSRLPSTATMLLTSVSYKWVIGRLLPTVSYLTSLDKYSLASLLIVGLQLLYHGVIAATYPFIPEKLLYKIDGGVFLLFASAIILMQLFFVNWLRKVNADREKLKTLNVSNQRQTSNPNNTQDDALKEPKKTQ